MKKPALVLFILVTSVLEAQTESGGHESIAQTMYYEHIFIILVSFLVIAALLFSRKRLKEKEQLSHRLLSQQEMLSRSVIEAEEKERSRIARELNEGIGQQLSAARMNISVLQSHLKDTSDEDRMILKNAVDLLDDSVQEVRNVTYSMAPHVLVKSGLAAAVRELVARVNTPGPVSINLEIIGAIGRMEQTREIVLFRILQEVINNALKHADAARIEVQLVKYENELSILVEDNGVGFDVSKAMEKDKGIGLKRIQSRVAFLHGTIFFDSRPEKGTTVTIEIPM